MRQLPGLGNGRHLLEDIAVDAGLELCRDRVFPLEAFGRHRDELTLIVPQVFGPGTAHHLKPFLDDLAVDGFDFGAAGAGGIGVIVLAHDPD
jgi:hypothetical protein